MNVAIHGRNLEVRLSRRAQRELEKRTSPLYVEIELYFSCLIRKRVLFADSPGKASESVNDKLFVSFHPVMTKSCGMENFEGELADFPIKKPAGFVPHWLELDFGKGKWQGEFGYAD